MASSTRVKVSFGEHARVVRVKGGAQREDLLDAVKKEFNLTCPESEVILQV